MQVGCEGTRVKYGPMPGNGRGQWILKYAAKLCKGRGILTAKNDQMRGRGRGLWIVKYDPNAMQGQRPLEGAV